MCLLAETLNALEGESIVRDVELFQIQVVKEHLFQSLISDVIINQVEDAQSLSKLLRNIEEQIVIDLTTIQLQMDQIGKSPQETHQQLFINPSEVMFEDLYTRLESASGKKLL